MKKTIYLTFALVMIVAVYTKNGFGQSWQLVPHLPTYAQNEFLTAHPEKHGYLYLGSRGSLYLSSNEGKSWKQTLNLGTGATLHKLYFHQDQIFLLTSEGLFESQNQGKKWKKIFSGKNENESEVITMDHDPVYPNKIYLGTKGGLFISEDAGKVWSPRLNELNQQFIFDLKADKHNGELFFASQKGIYRFISGKQQLDRVYRLRTISSAEELGLEMNDEMFDDSAEETAAEEIKSIVVTPHSAIFAATSHGILMSEDEGNRWEDLSTSGLQSTKILDLAYSSQHHILFAATDKGIYGYRPSTKTWKALKNGLSESKIKKLILVSNSQEILYAVTDQAVYQWIVNGSFHEINVSHFSEDHLRLFNQLIFFEPSIRQVHQKAIQYANVGNRKIKWWQVSSRLRALVPGLSIGKSFSRSDTVDIDRGSTTEPDQYILGPADQSRNWNFDLNWDVSDLIWNTAQTSIDSREKLMVELRDNILSEVTRIYFERRRAQMELILNPSQDPMEHVNAVLHIEELTALLDALTNGYVSKKLEDIYEKHPEFQNLWVFQASE